MNKMIFGAMTNSYTQLINKHEGENVFIFGAGTSLFTSMQHSFFKKLSKYGVTISVNSSVIVVPDFNYWISNDALCRRWSWWEDVKNGSGTKIVRESWIKYKKELDGFLFFSPRPTSEDVINPDDLGLAYCASVPSAIDLSIQMGCKKIFVFGLDHDEYMGKHHFWQFMAPKEQPKANPPAQGPWKQQKSVFSLGIKAYKALKGFADYRGAKIYNVSNITKVNIFEKIEMSHIEGKL